VVTEETKTPVLPVLLGMGGLAIIGLIAFFLLPSEPGEVALTPQETAAPASEPADVAEAPAEETASVPEAVAEAPAEPQPQGPTFDTFRVEPDGSMVIAGRAPAGQVIDIMLGGEVLERTTADAFGAFIALPTAPPSEQPRRLTLIGDPDGAAIEGITSYIVAPVAAPVVVAEEELEPSAVTSLEAVDDTATETAVDTTVADAPAVALAAPTLPAPPTVLETGGEGVRVVQGGAAQSVDNVALDAITYDPEGEVQLSGRAIGDGAVQVYLDNEPILTSPVTEGGDWRVDLPDIDTGVYTLRIDEVNEGGDVVSRIETPFKREEPEDVAAVLAEETAEDGFEVAVRTVQPGATLWAIAEENLGDGILYVEVFEANADLIRDPDLIYPGQIFRIPTLDE